MATKYSFHVRASGRSGEQRATGRADFGGNELNAELLGEKIVVPTKGCKFKIHKFRDKIGGLLLKNFFFFLRSVSAQATKCLPHASEIKIETGPFFGGIIMTENNENCRTQGDGRSDRDSYVMRIDHTKCGSIVDQETLTVKTFITVQENLGIFTHSTRR